MPEWQTRCGKREYRSDDRDPPLRRDPCHRCARVRYQTMGSLARGSRERQLAILLRLPSLANAGQGPKWGHECQFAPPRLRGRSAFSEETFAGGCSNEKDAPTSGLPALATEREFQSRADDPTARLRMLAYGAAGPAAGRKLTGLASTRFSHNRISFAYATKARLLLPRVCADWAARMEIGKFRWRNFLPSDNRLAF
jgi:hypothetical protein